MDRPTLSGSLANRDQSSLTDAERDVATEASQRLVVAVFFFTASTRCPRKKA
ncbi:MAG: hypothetical protein KA118_18055 [Verrucomicrobia bacterium]|nr:hypothetical protein [Verrucomicrobiota bacterium]